MRAREQTWEAKHSLLDVAQDFEARGIAVSFSTREPQDILWLTAWVPLEGNSPNQHTGTHPEDFEGLLPGYDIEGVEGTYTKLKKAVRKEFDQLSVRLRETRFRLRAVIEEI